MKQVTFYTFVFLLLSLMFSQGCKKDIFKGRHKAPTDTTKTGGTTKTDTTKTGDTTVSSVGYGHYDYITADGAGNVYALQVRFGADTIYKFDKTGNRSLFYTPAAVKDHDTLVVNTLTCLATDSLGNIYTVNNVIQNKVYVPDVIKITPVGSAGKIYSNVTTGSNGYPVYQLTVDGNGLVYFSDRHGIKRIAPNGSTSLLVNGIFNYAMDRKGDIFYATNNGVQVSIAERYSGGITSFITGSGSTVNNVIFDNITSLTTDRAGNLYIGETYDNTTRAAIFKLTHTEPGYNPVWTAKVILQNIFGHVDGHIFTAKIGVPFSMTTDAAGNLYFSEVTGTPNDIRKITF